MNWKLILRICRLIDCLEMNNLVDFSEEEAEIFLKSMYTIYTGSKLNDIESNLNFVYTIIGWENQPNEEIINIVKNFGLED